MKNTDHPENPYKLRTCVWEITLACCFSCRYCGSRAGRARQNELTTEECLNVADQLAELGCRRTALIGGEVEIRFEPVSAAPAAEASGAETGEAADEEPAEAGAAGTETGEPRDR